MLAGLRTWQGSRNIEKRRGTEVENVVMARDQWLKGCSLCLEGCLRKRKEPNHHKKVTLS